MPGSPAWTTFVAKLFCHKWEYPTCKICNEHGRFQRSCFMWLFQISPYWCWEKSGSNRVKWKGRDHWAWWQYRVDAGSGGRGTGPNKKNTHNIWPLLWSSIFLGLVTRRIGHSRQQDNQPACVFHPTAWNFRCWWRLYHYFCRVKYRLTTRSL